jgi:hypothetical protein
MGKGVTMSPVTTYKSRKGVVPCGDKDLYTFLTDMRNFQSVIPNGIVTDWQATEEECSFRLETTGKVTVMLKDAMPHSMVSYTADMRITGSVIIHVMIEEISSVSSAINLHADVNMNPIVKMMVGDAAPRYLDAIIGAIEAYGNYEKIRGCNQSL